MIKARFCWVALWLALAGSVDAHDAASPSDQSEDCGYIDADLAFVDGLAAFSDQTLMQAEHLADAEAHFARAVQCEPEYGSALYWLGVTHLLQDKPRQASEEISQSLEAREPPRAERWRILTHLAEAQFAAGEKAEARKSLDKAFREARRGLKKRQAADLDGSDRVAAISLNQALEHTGQSIKLPQGGPPVEDETFAIPRYRPFWPMVSPWRWESRLGFAVGRDSNPSLLDDGQIVFIPGSGQAQGGEADDVQEVDARLALYRLPPQRAVRNQSWSLGLTLEGRGALHQTLDFLDLEQGQAVVHLAWGKDPTSLLSGPLGYTRVPFGGRRLSVLLQATYLHARLDGETYLQSYGAALSIRLKDTQLELTYKNLDYAQAVFISPDRSGSFRAIQLSQFFYIRRPYRYIRVGLAAGTRDADAEYSHSFGGIYLKAAMPLKGRWALLMTASAVRENFDYPASGQFLTFGVPTFLSAEARLVWSVRPTLKLVASLGYVDRDSAALGLSHERVRSSLGFKWSLGSKG